MGNKGASFERDISRQLSLWWTHEKRDDVFWRSSMSGGRATVRAKKGQKTAYQNGDITATDPISSPLIENVVIELKRGYKKWGVLDLLDSAKPEKSTLAGFLAQVEEECKNAGVSAFMLICKRDGRKPIVLFPIGMLSLICYANLGNGYMINTYIPSIQNNIVCITLDRFLSIPPEEILESTKRYNNAEHDTEARK